MTKPADIGVQLFTISDTRKPENDRSGELMAWKIEASPFELIGQQIVRENQGEIEEKIKQAVDNPQVRAVITSGGTGLSDRDRTIEEIVPLFERKLEGFGELFRQLSYDQVGARCLLSRATAGRAKKTLIFILPGSPKAVELGLDELILPVLHHAIEVIDQ